MANPATIKIAPNVIQVSIHGKIFTSQPYTNVQYWQFPSAADAAACNTVASGAISAWQDKMLDLCSNEVSVTGATWVLLTSESSPTGSVDVDGTKPTVGTKVGPSTAANTAWLVHKILSTKTRNARNGRLYVAGPPDTEVDGAGNMTSGGLSANQALLDAYYIAAATLTSAPGAALMCQPHWTKANQPPIEIGGLWPAQSVSGVSSLRLDQKVATQRRRLRK